MELQIEYKYIDDIWNAFSDVTFKIIKDGTILCELYFEGAFIKDDYYVPFWDSGVYNCGKIYKKNFEKITETLIK